MKGSYKMGILDIIAKETGGERQYSDQYAISYKGSHYAHRQQAKPQKIYKAEYADENFEIFSFCDNDAEAMSEAEEGEKEHGALFGLFEVDEDYNEIRTIL